MKVKAEQITHSLQLEERLHLHQKGWVVQRVGWVVLLCIMLGGALGIFGEGLLSRRTLRSQQTALHYERFFRYEAEMPLSFDVAAATGTTVLWFEQPYLKKNPIKTIVPAPQKNYSKNGRVFFEFAATGPLHVAVYLMPEKAGSSRTSIGINNSLFRIHQFIYP